MSRSIVKYGREICLKLVRTYLSRDIETLDFSVWFVYLWLCVYNLNKQTVNTHLQQKARCNQQSTYLWDHCVKSILMYQGYKILVFCQSEGRHLLYNFCKLFVEDYPELLYPFFGEIFSMPFDVSRSMIKQYEY